MRTRYQRWKSCYTIDTISLLLSCGATVKAAQDSRYRDGEFIIDPQDGGEIIRVTHAGMLELGRNLRDVLREEGSLIRPEEN
jgi:alkyl hydroperoxide reductase subunit AhpC